MRRGAFLGSVIAAGATMCAEPALSQLCCSPNTFCDVEVTPPHKVVPGDEVLVNSPWWRQLTSARIGIITNQTGVTSSGVSVVNAVRSKGLNVHALYSPEHGLHGDRPAGAFVPSYVDGETGLPVYSLYGPDRHPTAEMLEGIDVLLFDIQDVGSRTYTFASTMAFALQSAAAHDIEFWVLDRPNPVGGVAVEGPVLDPRYSSFIGLYPIPMRHGMTMGELAQLFNVHFGIGAKLRVIPMEYWERCMTWPQTGLHWIRTSPNIPTWQTPFVYLCTGLTDDMGLNNGVGTPAPFFYAGTPHLDAEAFCARMKARGLPGISFEPTIWSPGRGGNAGRTFSGARLVLHDVRSFTPVRTAVELLVTARTMARNDITAQSIRIVDLDWGTDNVREAVLRGASADEIVASWKSGLDAFMPLRERFLLYT